MTKHIRKSLEDSGAFFKEQWDDIRPRPYKTPPRVTKRDVAAGAGVGVSTVVIAETLQWAVELATGGYHLPHGPALFFAAIGGMIVARYLRP